MQSDSGKRKKEILPSPVLRVHSCDVVFHRFTKSCPLEALIPFAVSLQVQYTTLRVANLISDVSCNFFSCCTSVIGRLILMVNDKSVARFLLDLPVSCLVCMVYPFDVLAERLVLEQSTILILSHSILTEMFFLVGLFAASFFCKEPLDWFAY